METRLRVRRVSSYGNATCPGCEPEKFKREKIFGQKGNKNKILVGLPPNHQNRKYRHQGSVFLRVAYWVVFEVLGWVRTPIPPLNNIFTKNACTSRDFHQFLMLFCLRNCRISQNLSRFARPSLTKNLIIQSWICYCVFLTDCVQGLVVKKRKCCCFWSKICCWPIFITGKSFKFGKGIQFPVAKRIF